MLKDGNVFKMKIDLNFLFAGCNKKYLYNLRKLGLSMFWRFCYEKYKFQLKFIEDVLIKQI